jgi:hypothetical protein
MAAMNRAVFHSNLDSGMVADIVGAFLSWLARMNSTRFIKLRIFELPMRSAENCFSPAAPSTSAAATAK